VKKLQVGMTRNEELEVLGVMQYREIKDVSVGWLKDFRPWLTKADLTFESLAAPERAEKAVRSWLCIIAPGCWAACGYERQDRGAVHAHLVIDQLIDEIRGERLWNKKSGFCRIGSIHSNDQAVFYLTKHAIKQGDWDVYGPGTADDWLRRGEIYSTGPQMQMSIKYTGKKKTRR